MLKLAKILQVIEIINAIIQTVEVIIFHLPNKRTKENGT